MEKIYICIIYVKYIYHIFHFLFQVGIQEQFDLGKWLEKRYGKLLGNQYSENKICVISNNVSRTIKSAVAVLQGIYSNNQSDSNKTNTFHVRRLQKSEDNLVMSTKACTRRDELLQEVSKSEEFLSREDPDLYHFLSNHSKMPVRNAEGAFYLHDNLNTANYHNLTLPKWSKDVFHGKLEQQVVHYLKSQTFTKELTRLEVGPLWNEIMSFFEHVKSDSLNSPRVFLISGQEFTLVNVLNSVGAFNNKKPPVSSTVMLELWHEIDRRYYIKIYLKNSTDYFNISFKNCGHICELSKVYDILEPIIITQEKWNGECERINYLESSYFYIGIVVFVLILYYVTYYQYRNLKLHYTNFRLLSDNTATNNYVEWRIYR